MTPENEEAMASMLRDVLEEFNYPSGTLHLAEGDELTLVTHEGIPESVLERIETVPVGKEIAGLAAEHREPVQVCNLQTDGSGVAEPDARATMMEGAIAAPIIESNGTLAGVIGIAKPEPYEFAPAERDRLMHAGEQIMERL